MVADAITQIRKIFGNGTTLNRITTVAKYVGVGDYTHVAKYQYKEIVFYRAYLKKFKWTKYFDNEREAAIAVDKKLLEKGKEPVNILKRKCN